MAYLLHCACSVVAFAHALRLESFVIAITAHRLGFHHLQNIYLIVFYDVDQESCDAMTQLPWYDSRKTPYEKLETGSVEKIGGTHWLIERTQEDFMNNNIFKWVYKHEWENRTVNNECFIKNQPHILSYWYINVEFLRFWFLFNTTISVAHKKIVRTNQICHILFRSTNKKYQHFICSYLDAIATYLLPMEYSHAFFGRCLARELGITKAFTLSHLNVKLWNLPTFFYHIL